MARHLSEADDARRPLSLMYVEDSEDDQIVFKRAGQTAGLSLTWRVAASAPEAIEYFRELIDQGRKGRVDWPGLVIVDKTLPGEDGFEVVRFVRGCPEMRRVPVVMLSGCVSSADQENSTISGAAGFMVKPCGFEETIGLIKQLHTLAEDFAKLNR